MKCHPISTGTTGNLILNYGLFKIGSLAFNK